MTNTITFVEIARARRRGARLASAWGLALVLGGAAAACQPEPPSDSQTLVEADVVRAPAPAAPEEDARSLSGPPSGLTPPRPGEERLVGTVAEHLPTGSYHYLKIQPERGESRWVVTMGGSITEGARVEVQSMGSRRDFYSRRLDRHFAELVFAVVDVVG